MSSSPSLRIGVIGMGGIGSTFAFQLARVGHHEVTAIGRPGSARLLQLQRDVGIIDIKGELAQMRIADTLDEETAYDLIVVTLLAHQVDAVLPSLQRSSAKNILFMFNNFEPERLRDLLGADRCSFGMPFIQATVDADGKLNAKIGAAGQKSKINRQRWVDVFVAAGLPAVLEPNMLLWLRCHVPLCVGFESVSVAGVRRSGGAEWSEAMVIAQGVQESFTLIERLGYRLYPAGKARLHTSPTWVLTGILWAMSRIPAFRNLLAGAIGECRALVDVLVNAAPQADLPIAVAKIQAMKPSQNTG